ncbi:shikimate dehydrogenase [Salinisphaera sp. Q1T1-3]|nr:shikimate dehydrogenase [Salinisphaera sp. Q1T1-3]
MDRYAVIGHPVEHSRSPDIHALFAEQTNQALVYDRLPAPRDGFVDVARSFFAEGGRGLNVTLPFKEQAAALADRLTARAERAGAVNTLMSTPDGLVGDNTDGAGLIADLTGRLGIDPVGLHVLILGAGGAVRGVVPSLIAAGVAHVTIANRTRDKAEAIAAACDEAGTVAATTLAAAPHDADLVINAISAGLAGEMPALDTDVLARARGVYDMIYSDTETPFLHWARLHGRPGVNGVDGFGMLVEQAAESFQLWRGIRPDTATVIARLRQPQDTL